MDSANTAGQADAVVRIECDDHQARNRHVRTFFHADGLWREALDANDVTGGRAGMTLAGNLVAEGDGEIDLSDPRATAGLSAGDPLHRVRYGLRCPAHRHGAVVVNEDRLHSVLDTLRANDIQSITLRALGAIVTSS